MNNFSNFFDKIHKNIIIMKIFQNMKKFLKNLAIKNTHFLVGIFLKIFYKSFL